MSGSRDLGAYEESGRGHVAREAELERKFDTYVFKDENPQRTEEEKEHIRRIEHEKEEYMKQHGLDTEPPEKKGLLGKILPGKHGHKDADKEEKTEGGGSTYDAANHGFRTDDKGNILSQNTSSHPDDPALGVGRRE